MSPDPARPRQVLARALAEPAPGQGPRVIALDGPAGSGKTTLAAAIGAATGAPVVHLDDLYDGWDGLETGVRHLVDGILEPLSRGQEGKAPRFDWEQNHYVGELVVPPTPMLVVEGVGAGARACAPYLTLLVWLEAGDGLERALARDGKDLQPRLLAWRDAEEAHHRTERTRARAQLSFET